jgi:Xaa-Pro aminopeptidase
MGANVDMRSAEFFSTRIQQLQEAIRERRLAGAVLFHSRDVLYYTGTAQPAYLVVLAEDYLLFVSRGYDFAQRDCVLPAERMIAEGKIDQICRRMFPGPGAGARVGTEFDLLTVPHARRLQEALRGREVVDITPEVLQQRMAKDVAEIDSIRKACAAVHAGHEAVLAHLKPGLSELELSAHVEAAQRLAGHDGMIFLRTTDPVMGRGCLGSGPNLRETSGTVYTLTGIGLSSAVPVGASRRVIEVGDLVLVDIPACVEGYHADQSRTYAVGRAPERAVDLFRRLRDVADFLMARVRPGMSCGEIVGLAFSRAEDLGLAETFMRFQRGTKAHFIGHGIGLEVNEAPLITRNSDIVLPPGAAIALEMHVMEPEGITVKLEDTLYLTHEGLQLLTLSPRELTVV